MRNIKLIIEYDGTKYCGFQRQKRHNSIQAELEQALSKVCSERIKIVSSGRTDSGVHAKGHVVNFQTNTKLSLKSILQGGNAYLPTDIVIRGARLVSPSFHARFSARRKLYRYQIWNSNIRSPLHSRFSYRYGFPLRIDSMRRAARVLEGTHDFKAFGRHTGKKENTVRTLHRLVISERGRMITFTCEGNSFLYNMVRTIVGTLLLVGRGKMTVQNVRDILNARDRTQAGPTVPPAGLFLIKVIY